MSKKISMILIPFLFIIVGLWIWTLAKPNNTMAIGGSASADPLMQKITQKYARTTGKNYIYSATGSGAGISNTEQAIYKLGFISKDPTEEFNNDYTSEIKNNDDATILESKKTYGFATVAIERLAFAYNDKNMNFNSFEQYMNLEISNGKLDNPSVKLMQHIYGIENRETITWRELADWISKNIASASTLASKVNDVKDVEIATYIPNPGSGTRSTLDKLLALTDGQNIFPDDAHVYNNNGSIFNQLKKSTGIGLLSFKFAISEDETSGMKNMTMNGKNIEQYNQDETSDNYPLSRKFNALFRIENNKQFQENMNFLNWMVNDPEAKKAYDIEKLSRPN